MSADDGSLVALPGAGPEPVSASLGDGAQAPIPVTVLTGFLGAGKTTLLNHVLAQPHGRRLAVLVNDFGSINIDAKLVVSVEDDRIALSNGCICCTIRDDLVSALLRLVTQEPRPDHVLVEASGISEPVGIAETLFQPDLTRFVTIDAMIAVCDAASYPELDFDSAEMVLRQASVADLLLLNKADIATSEGLAQLRDDLALAAPHARVLQTVQAQVPMDLLFGPAPGDAHAQDRAAARQALLHAAGAHHPEHEHEHEHVGSPAAGHTQRFETCSLVESAPLSLPALRRWVAALPTTLYRAKGIVQLVEASGRQAVFQLVGKRSSIELSRPWSGPPATCIVLIGARGVLDADTLQAGLQACVAAAPPVHASESPEALDVIA